MKKTKIKAVNKHTIIQVLKSLHTIPMVQLILLRVAQLKKSIVNQRLVRGIRQSSSPVSRLKKRKNLLVFVKIMKKKHRKLTARCEQGISPSVDPSWIPSVVKVPIQYYWQNQRTLQCLDSHTLRILTILLRPPSMRYQRRNQGYLRFQSTYEQAIPRRPQLNESCAKVRSTPPWPQRNPECQKSPNWCPQLSSSSRLSLVIVPPLILMRAYTLWQFNQSRQSIWKVSALNLTIPHLHHHQRNRATKRNQNCSSRLQAWPILASQWETKNKAIVHLSRQPKLSSDQMLRIQDSRAKTSLIMLATRFRSWWGDSRTKKAIGRQKVQLKIFRQRNGRNNMDTSDILCQHAKRPWYEWPNCRWPSNNTSRPLWDWQAIRASVQTNRWVRVYKEHRREGQPNERLWSQLNGI